MSVAAIIERAVNQPLPAATKRERINPRILRAVEGLASGQFKTQKDAAAVVGLSEAWLCKTLQKPAIQAFITRSARQTIAQAAFRAARRVHSLIDADSEHVSLDASKHVLAIEGIKPTESGTSISVTVNTPGYVVDLTPAKPLIEHGE